MALDRHKRLGRLDQVDMDTIGADTSVSSFICMYVCIYTVEPVYYGHLGTNKKCPDYQVFQVSLYDKAPFGTITKCGRIMQVSLFSSVLINRSHCTRNINLITYSNQD